MKKIVSAVFAVVMALSIVFIGDVLSASAQSMQGTVTARHRRRGVASRTYRGGRYVVRRTWDGTKWTTHKVKRGTKWTAHKTKRGAKHVFHKTKRAIQ